MIYKYIYLSIISISLVIGIVNYRILNIGGKILTAYLLSVLTTEILALIVFKTDNLLVYITGCSFQYALVLFYFNESFSNIKKRNLGLITAPLSIFIFFIITHFKGIPTRKIYEYLILMEGFFIISFCLMAYYYLLVKDMSTQILRVFDFWIVSLLFLFWSLSYFYWGFSGIIFHYKYHYVIYYFIWVVNCILYGGIGYILYSYKKGKLGTAE